MYKVIRSLWPKSFKSNKTQATSDVLIDEDSWVVIPPTANHCSSSTNTNIVTNSWIEPTSSNKIDEPTRNIHNFNPIENLLIEHASMSVYEQIASKTRNRCKKNPKLNEQVEELHDDNEDEDDDRISTTQNYSNAINRNMNISTLTPMESSLVVHHRHLQRLNQRRKRSVNRLTPSVKSTLSNTNDESKQESNENLE